MSAVPANAPTHHGEPRSSRLFHTRYSTLAANTIDYWLLPDDPTLTTKRVAAAVADAPVLPEASLQLYLHVPFCAQRCTFCAFSGGNSLEFREAERYAKLLVAEMNSFIARTAAMGLPVRSVHIGGGSPDLLGEHITTVLRAVRDLPGVDAQTELAVEFTASTVTRSFIDALVAHDVTKASFGVQSVDPTVRKAMRQPASNHFVDRALAWIDGRIPVVNADLITGLPGQSLQTVNRDLRALLDEPRIHAISSYLLTAAAAPSLVAAVTDGQIPQPAPAPIQAAMRLHTYSTFQRAGWIRRGTNTYIDPARIEAATLEKISGNECIGTADYEAFLLGIGAQAVSSMPGARVENLVDIEPWCTAVENGEPPWFAAKCSTEHQIDTALWVMPLRWEGLTGPRFERMRRNGSLSAQQLRALAEFVDEGLIVESQNGYELSILGEVFMGHLVRELKSPSGRRAVDEYAGEGHAIGRAIADGKIPDTNATNNRQSIQAAVREP